MPKWVKEKQERKVKFGDEEDSRFEEYNPTPLSQIPEVDEIPSSSYLSTRQLRREALQNMPSRVIVEEVEDSGEGEDPQKESEGKSLEDEEEGEDEEIIRFLRQLRVERDQQDQEDEENEHFIFGVAATQYRVYKPMVDSGAIVSLCDPDYSEIMTRESQKKINLVSANNDPMEHHGTKYNVCMKGAGPEIMKVDFQVSKKGTRPILSVKERVAKNQMVVFGAETSKIIKDPKAIHQISTVSYTHLTLPTN